MKRERTTLVGGRRVGARRYADLLGRWRVPALFGLAIALALLTPVLGVGSYLASLLVAGAAVVVAATAPVRRADAAKPLTRQRDAVGFASARALSVNVRRAERPLRGRTGRGPRRGDGQRAA